MAEESDTLASSLSSSQQDSVRALGGAEGELIKSYALTTSLDNASSSSLSETESSNLELRDLQHADVVSNGANNNSGLTSLAGHVASDAGEGEGGVVDSGHSNSLEDGVSELGISSSGNEAINREIES